MASNPAEATIVTTERHRPADPGAVGEQASHAAMRADLERLLAAARPGLSRVARRQGVAPDAVEDVVQETLLTAWRSLGQLRSPERFDAWLAGICRNVGRHQRRAAGRLARRQVPFADVTGDPWDDAGGRRGLSGHEQEAPLAVPFDFAEDLARRDLEALLDRALAHLSAGAREVLHLCDLLETPQREAALRLGLTVDALEQRLLRARRQLRAVLHGTLRADAAAFGLLLDADPATGWRETREWCMLCGRQRMRGLFDPRPDGRVRLRMRCPACSPRHGGGGDLVHTGDAVCLDGAPRSFRPAFRRAMALVKGCYAGAVATGTGRCTRCGAATLARLAGPGAAPDVLRDDYWVTMLCPRCGYTPSSAVASIVCWGDGEARPAVQRFMDAHPRWIGAPARPDECAGHPAIRVTLADVAGPARLTVLVHASTLRVLMSFEE